MDFNQELSDKVLQEVVLQPIGNTVIPLQNAIHTLINDYKFLFNDDYEVTKRVLLDSCFRVDLTSNALDVELLLSSISDETKDNISKKVLPQLLELITLDKLK